MKKFFSSLCLSFLIIVIMVWSLSSDRHLISKNVKAQTVVTPTPCPSPIKPSNTVDRCHPYQPPKPPTPEEIAERQKQEKERKIKLERILKADYPLSSKFFVDFDGDGKKDEIFYQLKPFEDFYEGLLKITSSKGKILWEDNFPMDTGDLAEWLEAMSDIKRPEVTITDWVQNAFNEKYNYAFDAENRKIKRKEIDGEQIAYAAKMNKVSAAKLKSEILAQKTNRIFTYRSTWREDLMQIVYVPSLKKFVCFARGYY